MQKWNYNELAKCVKNPPPLVSFREFKQYHKQFPLGICPSFERVIAEIQSVIVGRRVCSIYFDDGTSAHIHYDGYYERFNRKGKIQSTGGTGTDTGFEKNSNHIKFAVCGKQISLERLVAVCVDISKNRMPLDYTDICANVMDGTGSIETAHQFGCPQNFEPDNLEWCSRGANSSHGWLSKQVFLMTDCVYRISAYDTLLKSLVKNLQKNDVEDYCNFNLFRVK